MAIIASGTISTTGRVGVVTPRAAYAALNPITPVDMEVAAAISLRGAFSGSVTVERSLDGGGTWAAVSRDSTGTPATYTAAFEITVDAVPRDVQYALNVTALSSGTPSWSVAV
jgi:hypothetical protein